MDTDMDTGMDMVLVSLIARSNMINLLHLMILKILLPIDIDLHFHLLSGIDDGIKILKELELK